jgi:hypothetical protein
MKILKLSSIILLATMGFVACKPKMVGDFKLPAPTPADFTIAIQSINSAVAPSDNNFVIVENTTGFLSSWTFQGANIASSTRQRDSIYFQKAGTYTIKLESSSKGGISSVTKTVTIAEDSKIPANFEITPIDAYHFKLKNTTSLSVGGQWFLPDGTTSFGNEDTAYVAYAGDSEIKLKAELIKGVFVSVVKTVTIATNDPNNTVLNDSIFVLLTGGASTPNGKTWVVDNGPKKTNVGAGSNMTSSYYNWPDGFSEVGFVEGIYLNEFTFKPNQMYVPKNQSVTAGAQYAEAYFGIEAIGDWTNGLEGSNGSYNNIKVQDPKHVASPFIYKTNDWDYIKDKNKTRTSGATIEFTTGSYFGWFTNQYKFFIVSITPTQMVVGHYYDDHAYTDSPANKTFSTTKEYNNHRILTFNVKP